MVGLNCPFNSMEKPTINFRKKANKSYAPTGNVIGKLNRDEHEVISVGSKFHSDTT